MFNGVIVLCDMYVHLISTGFNLKKELCDLESGIMTSAEERPKMKGGAPTVPREEITKHLMETKEHEFTEVQHFTVCAATWNVNGKCCCWLEKCLPRNLTIRMDHGA